METNEIMTNENMENTIETTEEIVKVLQEQASK